MVSLEIFGSAEGARTSGSRDMGCGGVTRRFGFGVGRTVANRLDPYIHRGIVAIVKSRVGSIMLLHLAYKLGEELKYGRGSDVSRILASEFHELVIEGGHHIIGEASHDVMDQVWSEGDIVEVFHVVELLDDFQVGQQGLDLESQIFSDLLDGFVARKEVKYLVDVVAEDVDASKFFNEPCLKVGPVVDGVEGTFFI